MLPQLHSTQYFVSIVPSEPVFSEINELKQYMSDRFSSRAALRSPPHITLHMPFQWNPGKEERLFDSLKEFAAKKRSFHLTLNGFGCFAPRVIYVKVETNDDLNKIQSDMMDHARMDLNLFNANYRNRPFHPHATIAFRDLKKAAFHEAWEEFEKRKYSAVFSADSFSLLKHNGKRWDAYKEFRLTL